MNPMEPVCDELNTILPPLKQKIREDVDVLDTYLRNLKADGDGIISDDMMACWDNVREAAISFTLIIGKPMEKDTKREE